MSLSLLLGTPGQARKEKGPGTAWLWPVSRQPLLVQTIYALEPGTGGEPGGPHLPLHASPWVAGPWNAWSMVS